MIWKYASYLRPLNHYWEAVRRRKQAILAVVAVAIGLAVLLAAVTPSTWESRSQVLMEAPGREAMLTRGIEFAKSQRLAEAVANQVKLHEFFGVADAGIASLELMKRTTVTAVQEGSQITPRFSVQLTDPHQAAHAATAYATQFIAVMTEEAKPPEPPPPPPPPDETNRRLRNTRRAREAVRQQVVETVDAIVRLQARTARLGTSPADAGTKVFNEMETTRLTRFKDVYLKKHEAILDEEVAIVSGQLAVQAPPTPPPAPPPVVLHILAEGVPSTKPISPRVSLYLQIAVAAAAFIGLVGAVIVEGVSWSPQPERLLSARTE